MLAQKVETRDTFLVAKKQWVHAVSGIFLSSSEIQQARQISATQITYVRLLSAISKAEVDFTEIEDW